MISKPSFRMFVTAMLLFSCYARAADYFSGRVYSGNKWDESTPIANVAITLYGSANPDQIGMQLGTTTTQAGTGWYQLIAPRGYTYYHIVETTPSGYHSTGAASVDGNVIDNDHIRYSIVSNHLSEQTLTGNKFWDAPNAPDIDVFWNSIKINDGSTTPSSANGTEFGSVDVSGGNFSRSYTIENTGTADLDFIGVTISGSGDFTVTTQPATSLPAGGRAPFTVRFDPSAAGTHSATVNIANNSAKNPYDFAVRGTGTQTQQEEWDYGDAGIYIDQYPIYFAQNGARHKIVPGFCLGTLIDAEPDGQSDYHCDGDDHNGIDDEDGVKFIFPYHFGQECTVEVTATIPAGMNGYLDAWYDYNHDKIWTANEKVFDSVLLTNGTNTFSFILPMTEQYWSPVARFRLSSTGGLDPTGPADDGEVEDHYCDEVYWMDYGDAPSPYPTLLSDNGARHTGYCYRFGSALDPDSIGFPDPDALGDDNDHADDEDGVVLPILMRGQPAQVFIEMSPFQPVTNLSSVQAWIDWNQDGIWQHPGEQAYSGSLPDGGNTITIQVPITAKSGNTFARFRSSYHGGLTPVGYAGFENQGEVEDYKVTIEEPGSYEWDFGDAPEGGFGSRTYNYPTTLANNGARHRITRYGPWLGNERPDAEPDGLPDLEAKGDDLSNNYSDKVCRDEELYDMDGYLASAPVEQNHIWVDVGSEGIVEVWIDYNHDGTWQHPAEQVYSGFLPVGWHQLFFTPTADVKTGDTYLRARISTAGGLLPGGPANDGEVIDKKIDIYPLEFGDAPDSYGTRLVNNGSCAIASYSLYNKWAVFGEKVDSELDGLPDLSAEGDDNDGIDDEDGINFQTILEPGFPATVQVDFKHFKVNCLVEGWIDFNQDGVFDEISENILHVAEKGLYTWPSHKLKQHTFPVPGNAVKGLTYARFRISGEYLQGTFPDPTYPCFGEIEDYAIWIGEDGPLPPGSNLDFGDAPASYGDASHKIGSPWFGGFNDAPDPETASQYDSQAQGDDTHGNNDENGLVQTTLIAGQTTGSVRLEFVPGPSGEVTISGWLDYNGNGNWTEDLGSVKFSFGPMPAGGWQNPVTIHWPLSNLTPLKAGYTIARFRIYEGANGFVSPTGSAGFGEVEDHQVEIKSDGDPVLPGGVIFGTKWEDQDGDGIKDAGEPVLPGWEIWLDANQNGIEDAGDQYDFTDASGQFEFQGLSAGQYLVGEKMQSGWTQTCPGGSGTHLVDIDPAKPSLEILFGNQWAGTDMDIGSVKWSQPPLYDPTSEDTTCYWGWNETSVYSQSFLADDWFCHDPRPVTCIRWWGAYADWDSLFAPPTVPEGFQIGIWTDVSNDSAAGFSHPGEMVQEWFVSRNAVHETIDKTYYFNEFMDDPSSCFRYTYYIPENDWFYQEGDSTVYWLSIAPVYETLPDSNFWGWLTREHYFNDDAVRVLQPLMPQPGNVYETGGMVSDFRDFAFELGTDEYESIYDFGDAPDLGYGTTLERNGPQHLFDTGVRLGALIDSEADGLPSADASGDDHNGSADEDGVVFLNDLIPGDMAEIKVTTSTSGYLNAWIDFHGDTKWNWPFDFVFTDVEVEAGTHSLQFPVPDNASLGSTMARFRYSTWPKVYFRGFAVDGEVEDYQVTIGTTSDVAQSGEIPKKYNLDQNYPNPFNPSTQISFALPKKGRIELAIYNVQGAKVRTLVSGIKEPGNHIVIWDGADKNGKHAPSGLYLCRIQAAGYHKTIKMLILK